MMKAIKVVKDGIHLGDIGSGTNSCGERRFRQISVVMEW